VSAIVKRVTSFFGIYSKKILLKSRSFLNARLNFPSNEYMKKLLLLSAVLLGAVTASQAGIHFNFGIGLPLPPPPPIVIAPAAPVYVQPPVYAPAPVVVTPQVYAPAPIVVTPQVYAPAPVVVVPPRVVVAPPVISFRFGPRPYWGHYHGEYHRW
jgi:hypothetical protein